MTETRTVGETRRASRLAINLNRLASVVLGATIALLIFGFHHGVAAGCISVGGSALYLALRSYARRILRREINAVRAEVAQLRR